MARSSQGGGRFRSGELLIGEAKLLPINCPAGCGNSAVITTTSRSAIPETGSCLLGPKQCLNHIETGAGWSSRARFISDYYCESRGILPTGALGWSFQSGISEPSPGRCGGLSFCDFSWLGRPKA